MLVKNLTPFFHGTKLTSRHPPTREMMLVVRGTFQLVADGTATAVEGLDQGLLSGDRYADGDDDRAGELVHASDFADFKLNAEVLLTGCCHPPAGKPVGSCPVRFQVGEWKKDLVVLGERTWTGGVLGGKPSAPAPFEVMPIGWTRAFGGPGFEPNPVGRGLGGELLPNVEAADRLVTSRSDRPAPAGYGPLNPAWPPRAGKLGTNYGRSYLAKRAPFYADDFDWTHFHAAPPDQQLPGYLRGDERLVLHNLVAGHPVLTTELPALRVRAFLKDDQASFREIGMVLDTLLVDTEAAVVRLSWRGLEPVREDDFADVCTMLIASEPLGDERRPQAEYQAALEAYEQDPTGVLASLPKGMMEAWERYQAEARGEPLPPAPAPAGADPVTAFLADRAGGMVPSETVDRVGSAMAGLASLPKEAEVAERLKLEEAIEKARVEAQNDPPTMRVRKPGSFPDARIRQRMRLVQAEVATLRKVEQETGKKLSGLDELAAVPHDPRWKQLEPDYEVPGPLPTDPPGPGADLRERDLRAADLSGMDLHGANLERADLSRAILRGANLRGAKLGRAILWLCDLEEADLTEADLTLANAAYVKAPNARFERAILAETFFEGARLSGATLDGARAPYAIFDRADLSRASACQACFDHGDFSRANLEGAKLRGATASLALFEAARAARSDWSGATIEQAAFPEADLRGALFVDAKATRAYFLKARLDDAELSFALLRQAHFTEASLVRARGYGADLEGARLYRAVLVGARLERANLKGVDLRKAQLEGASFAGSSLYEAVLVDVRGKHFDLTDAKLGRAVVERAKEGR